MAREGEQSAVSFASSKYQWNNSTNHANLKCSCLLIFNETVISTQNKLAFKITVDPFKFHISYRCLALEAESRFTVYKERTIGTTIFTK